jgi:hypothetical protein
MMITANNKVHFYNLVIVIASTVVAQPISSGLQESYATNRYAQRQEPIGCILIDYITPKPA